MGLGDEVGLRLLHDIGLGLSLGIMDNLCRRDGGRNGFGFGLSIGDCTDVRFDIRLSVEVGNGSGHCVGHCYSLLLGNSGCGGGLVSAIIPARTVNKKPSCSEDKSHPYP